MPTTRSRTGQPGSPNNRSNSQHNGRQHIAIKELAPGCIVWLPAKAESDRNNNSMIKCIRLPCCGNEELNVKGYDHPVLILEIKPGGRCSFAQVTSQIGKSRSTISQRWPIEHDEAVQSNCLHLEKGKMDKASYVKTEHIFEASVALLRSLNRSSNSKPFDTRLTEESYERFAKQFNTIQSNLEIKVWIKTDSLRRRRRDITRIPPDPQPLQPHHATDAAIRYYGQADIGGHGLDPSTSIHGSGAPRHATALNHITSTARSYVPSPQPGTAYTTPQEVVGRRWAHPRQENRFYWTDLESNPPRWPSDDSSGRRPPWWGWVLLVIGVVGSVGAIGALGYLLGAKLWELFWGVEWDRLPGRLGHLFSRVMSAPRTWFVSLLGKG